MISDSEGNILGSETARNDLISAIDNDQSTVDVFLTDGMGSKGQISNMIGLDRKQIDGFTNNSYGNLTPKTIGYGMTFLHELTHTELGGGLRDPGNDQYGTRGQTVNHMNTIRRELDKNPINKYLNNGLNYGQRAQYHPVDNGPSTNPNIRKYYMRFIGRGNKVTFQIEN
jgi:hypothetical protein